MIAYHGTNAKFKAFNQEFMQQNGLYGTGAYFGKVEEYAAQYGVRMLHCEIPNLENDAGKKQYLIGDEINDVPYSTWKKLCTEIYKIDNTGFFNYGNLPKEQLIRTVARRLQEHEFLISAIIELSSCIYTDLSILKQYFPYMGICMCDGGELTVWDSADIAITKTTRVKS